MIRPDADVSRAVEQLLRMNSGIPEFIGDWYRRELSSLPMAISNAAVAQGRCQVLGELNKLFNPAPETTHTDRSV